jgi:hypothetical protein
VHEAVGYCNKNPGGAPGDELLMNDQACLNGLTKAHFIGQQNPGCEAISGFIGNVELVGQ